MTARAERRAAYALAVCVLAAACTSSAGGQADDPGAAPAVTPPGDRVFAASGVVERACSLPGRYLARLWRGYHPVHSEDVTVVPNEPNFAGSFTLTSHSGPWDYLQGIPLVLYGPGRIAAAGEVERPVTLADVYPTIAELMEPAGVVLPTREGTVLDEALAQPAGGVPKLVLTVVWDGGGRNTLELWKEKWPELARLSRDGTSYVNAVVGSSPSITPASHATLGAGVFPRTHTVTSIDRRTEEGNTRVTLEGQDPSDLGTTTFADETDLALGNEPKIGLIAYNTWHLAMMGHGLGTPGGDADLLGTISWRDDGAMLTNTDYYSLPSYLEHFPGLEEHAAELDRKDGRVDGLWMGHEILEKDDNPAWTYFHLDTVLAALEREGFGNDDVSDFFFVNFKQTDMAGHRWSIDSKEFAAVLRAQDRALGRLVEYLDKNVGDYVVIVTADHGHTRSPYKTGAWPISQGELKRDVQRHFGVPADRELFPAGGAYGLYLDYDLARTYDVTPKAVARFLNDYTIRDNWTEDDLPPGYESRGNEQVFASAFPTDRLPRIMRCKFGSASPPPNVGP